MHWICKALVWMAPFAAALPAQADDNYQVSKTDAVVTVGSKGKASVTIAAKQGWHLNAEAPLTLKLGTTPGLDLEKAKLGRSDLALSNETQARFDVGVTASEPGKRALDAEASFVLCQESACQPVKSKLTLNVDATEKKADAPATAAGKAKAKKK
jgi:DsbC/DsbD-like thiol-disulfide interchange protein